MSVASIQTKSFSDWKTNKLKAAPRRAAFCGGKHKRFASIINSMKKKNGNIAIGAGIIMIICGGLLAISELVDLLFAKHNYHDSPLIILAIILCLAGVALIIKNKNKIAEFRKTVLGKHRFASVMVAVGLILGWWTLSGFGAFNNDSAMVFSNWDLVVLSIILCGIWCLVAIGGIIATLARKSK